MLLRLWISSIITFASACAPTVQQSPDDLAPVPQTTAPLATYHVSEVTIKPKLTNTSSVTEAFKRLYPPALRDAGVGGTTIFAIVIDPTGKVAEAQVVRSSGYVDMDQAGRRILDVMRFAPGKLGGVPVRVRYEMPITWTVSR